MFEIKRKDGLGRIGIFTVKNKKVQTPTLMPVIHPKKQEFDIKKFNKEIVITNAYIIYRDEELREEAIKKGVHKLIDFDGVVMTDSGSFQLSKYGDIDVSNKEIIEFQEKIGSDIGTSLDIPTPPYVSRKRAEEELDITIKRAIESLDYRKDMLLNAVVQGSTYPDLRARCAKELSKYSFDVHPIGAVVPLLESYDYRTIVNIVMSSVQHLPRSRPIHLMGAGHPMLFALMVAMGCDLFDSAAYMLYAQDDRFLSPHGTYKLQDLQEMPCTCPICLEYTPEELRRMEKDERYKLISQHNLYVSFSEMRRVRQAIYDGSLMELVEKRCRSHPTLLDAYRELLKYKKFIEKYDPVTKPSAFFYLGPESLRRVEIYRHFKKIKQLPKRSRAILLPSYGKPYNRNIPKKIKGFYRIGNSSKPIEESQFFVVDVPFCIIPLGVDELYPLAQCEVPKNYDLEMKEFLIKKIEDLFEEYEEVLVNELVNERFDLGLSNKYRDDIEIETKIEDLEIVKLMADYQFGEGSGEALFNGNIRVLRSRKTGRIRYIYEDDVLLATIRPPDGFIILTWDGAKKLHENREYPLNRVVVNEEAEPFVKAGRNVFAKFIIDCDKKIRANDEVLVVNKDDELIAFGKAVLSSYEMMEFERGVAVKNRKEWSE
ncbi:archaeosine tRNA-ribosyltransferase [Methanothermus fervidus DSM 2088]|uniref:tRNA-guanine(15) transglycosylase n=1 Tax=Methanothermus fervidus (strain ATCC 43054 / DSM 2088 / JCM 10308 / V24 S) TaxID=523846 RepID=E3GX71_METFV|nr:tRNA guanosine(15) transglycosylase TgtA [Methanothermus fervidus]ADP78066.1 archaeosine tRNA-ribosyltransferase [Methanothermus fervidus DSM 2088]